MPMNSFRFASPTALCLGSLLVASSLLAACGDDGSDPEPQSALNGASTVAGSGGAGGNGGGGGAPSTSGSGGVARAGEGQGGNLSLAGSAGTAGSGAGGEAGTPRALWNLTGIIGTGQSLAVGAQATEITGSQASFNNLKLGLGNATVPPFNSDDAALSLVPLQEPIRTPTYVYPGAYPGNIWGESFHTAMASQITELAQAAGLADYVTVHTVVGESGQGMNIINKAAVETNTGNQSTGRAYNASLFEARAIQRLATAQSQTYGIGALFLTHGETDSGNQQYEDQMIQLASDYNTDLKAITGQTENILLFTSQQHPYGFTAGQRSGLSPAAVAQWRIGIDHPDQAVCTGPKYQYPYFTDQLHLVSRGYDLLGEKYGEVYFEKVVLGHDWKPLQPTTVERNGAVITVNFDVPVAPLAWDEAIAAPFQGTLLSEWSQGRGFEVRMGDTPISISSVEIVDNSVQITCASDVPAGATVGYAASSDGVEISGVSHRRGQLKDSDPLVGALTGETQANYAVAFELPVP